MSSATANELLNPADKQNVPKAVNLVRSLVRLQTLPDPLNPTESRRRHTLIFLAKVLDFFVLPFINIEMTLSQQIRSLSAYAHLVAAMYLGHGLAFLTGALYADSQAIVKNIMFCVARLQIISGDLEFFIIHEGTDRLETIFSDVRTQDQNRNFFILQLSQKLSVGAAIMPHSSATLTSTKDIESLLSRMRRALITLIQSPGKETFGSDRLSSQLNGSVANLTQMNFLWHTLENSTMLIFLLCGASLE